jgi:drug/metabolite transporter (DMT)-like permease
MAKKAESRPSVTARPRPRLGHLDLRSGAQLAVGMACFGSAIPVSAIVGEGLPLWLGAELRLLAAALLVVPVHRVFHRDEPGVMRLVRTASPSDRLLLGGLAVVGTFGFTALMFLGMRYSPGAVAAVVMATTPAVTAVGAFLFLRERLGRYHVLAVALAVAGVIVVNLGSHAAHGSGTNLVLGSLLVFGAVCCEASYSLMGKRLTAQLSPLAITAAATTMAAIVTMPFALWDLPHVDWSDTTPGHWVAVLWWGIGTMAVGSWLWFRGMARVAGSTAAAFMGVMPVSALVLSYLLLDEDPQWIHAAGLGLVLAGILLSSRVESMGRGH